MKSGRSHRVPLSDEALRILDVVRPLATVDDSFIFPGIRQGTALSNMSLSAVLKRMDRGAVTVHGFRSCFRDWCGEQTSYPREVCEAALAHVNADRVEAAYLRSDLFERRRQLMNDWSTYCISSAAIERVKGRAWNVRARHKVSPCHSRRKRTGP